MVCFYYVALSVEDPEEVVSKDSFIASVITKFNFYSVSDQNFENNSSMSTGRSIHLLTNEDSNKVLRMSLSKSEKRSKGSSDLVEIEQKPRRK